MFNEIETNATQWHSSALNRNQWSHRFVCDRKQQNKWQSILFCVFNSLKIYMIYIINFLLFWLNHKILLPMASYRVISGIALDARDMRRRISLSDAIAIQIALPMPFGAHSNCKSGKSSPQTKLGYHCIWANLAIKGRPFGPLNASHAEHTSLSRFVRSSAHWLSFLNGSAELNSSWI